MKGKHSEFWSGNFLKNINSENQTGDGALEAVLDRFLQWDLMLVVFEFLCSATTVLISHNSKKCRLLKKRWYPVDREFKDFLNRILNFDSYFITDSWEALTQATCYSYRIVQCKTLDPTKEPNHGASLPKQTAWNPI